MADEDAEEARRESRLFYAPLTGLLEAYQSKPERLLAALDRYEIPVPEVRRFAAPLESSIRKGMVVGFTQNTHEEDKKKPTFASTAEGYVTSFDFEPGETVTTKRAIQIMKDAGVVRPERFAEHLAGAKEWAITSARLQNTAQIAKVKRLILDELGASGVTKLADISDLKGPMLGRMDYDNFLKRWESEALPALEEYQTRLIYDMNMKTAHSASNWIEVTDPSVDGDIAALMYKAVIDERTRPEHEIWNGTTHDVDSPFWDTHYPPNDFNCRCYVVAIYKHQADGKKIMSGKTETGNKKTTASAMKGNRTLEGVHYSTKNAPRVTLPVNVTADGTVYDFNRNVGKLLKEGEYAALSGA